ncbi:DMT family transporter [Candidatus Woesearchaeota archaeon]|nr:DMT family transporter [Candidatus Woesearchaeota archaeon]
MLWAILSVLSGLWDAVMFALMKKLSSVNNTIVVWVQFAFALPFLALILFFSYPDRIDSGVYMVAIANALLYLGSTFLFLKALNISKLSVSLPMLSFTPLFLLVISYFTLKEIPSFTGFIGIMLIVVGAYTINLKSGKGFLEPFLSIFKVKGSLYILIVAFIWSITSILFKKGILMSSPVYFTTLVYIIVSAVMVPFLLVNAENKIKDLKSNFKLLLFLGLMSGLMNLTASFAMLYAIVPYVISLKRTGLIFSVLIGYFFFNEKYIRKSLAGTLIMIAGGVLITLF